MLLGQVLEALKDNPNTNIALVESNNTPLITFNASGYENIESDLLQREVSTITIKNTGCVSVKLVALQVEG